MTRVRTRARRTARSAVVVLAAVASLAVQAATATAVGASPALQATGSSFAGVAIQGWTSQSGILLGTNINFQISNSVTGLSFFAQNQIDFGASDIPYSSGQSAYNPTVPYQYLPDVAGGLAMMYNLTGNDGQRINSLDLDAQAIADIFLGRIQYWDNSEIAGANPQLAGLLPHVPIIPVYRSDGAGENYLLSDYLLHQANSTFVAAQTAFGLSTTGPAAIGQPSATWPQPACLVNGGCGSRLSGYPGWTTGTGLEGAAGADISANDVASAQSNGAITYVETAYAKEHSVPVANVVNQNGAAVQPTSVNVATALEQAVLHADLTQDLTNVYTNPLPNAYPLSAYSYLVTQCSPTLAAAQHVSCAADPNGAGSNFPTDKGLELGQFLDFMACAGQRSMASIGYSPLPPNLVQADFNAIGRLNGGQQPPPPTAANCKNPYVDGTTPLPGQPVVPGVSVTITVTPGASPGGSAGAQGSAAAGAPASGASAGSKGGTGSGSSATAGASGTTAAAVAKACASGTALAAQACTADGTLKSGFAVVNGQVVRTLGAAGTVGRAAALLAATHLVTGPGAGAVLGWLALAFAILLAPPLYATYRKRSRTKEGTS